MAVVLIPTPLRAYTDNNARLTLPGATVAEVLGALCERHTGLTRHLRDDSGKLRSFVNLYVGDEDIRYLQGEATVVGEDTELTLVPSIAGGRS